MLADQSSNNNEQTFNDLDGFKILVLADSPNRSIEVSKWLSSSTKEVAGTFRKQHKKTFFAFFPYFFGREVKITDSSIYDALIIFADTEEEFTPLKDETFQKYKQVPVRLLVSRFSKAHRWGNELNIKSVILDDQTTTAEIMETLLTEDSAFYSDLKRKFSKFDDDKSGSIELNELAQIAKSLGEDPKSENFKKSLMALDINHDNKLSFDEFLQWWKFGRNNIDALAKIYEFNNKVNEYIFKTWNFINLKKESRNLEDDIDSNAGNGNATKNKLKNNISVAVSSLESFNIKTRINAKISIGQKERLESAKNYLSKFSDDLTTAKSDWFSIGVFLKANSLTGKEAAVLLESFRDNLLAYTEKHYVKGLSSFISSFLTFQVIPYEYSANLVIRLKFDVKSLVFYALENVVLLRDLIVGGNNPNPTTKNNDGFNLDFNFISGQSLGEISERGTLNDLLKNAEIYLQGYSQRSRTKILIQNLVEQYRDYLPVLQYLFVPSNLKVEFTGPVDELLDNTSKEFLNKKLDSTTPLFTFLKENLDKKLYDSLTRVEFTLNFFDIFANLQLYAGCFSPK